MFLSSLSLKPLPSLFPFSRNNSHDENYHIKKRNNLSSASEEPVLFRASKEIALKPPSFNVKGEKTTMEKRDLHSITEKEHQPPSKKIHNANKTTIEEIGHSDSSDSSNSSKKSSKYLQKFLTKVKLQKNEFITLESCVKNNKLSFLPYIRCQETQFNNMIIPVLPKALFDEKR